MLLSKISFLLLSLLLVGFKEHAKLTYFSYIISKYTIANIFYQSA